MTNPSSTETPLEPDLEPNDDGCVLGTAGRDEDPNATTDWDHPADSDTRMNPGDTRGLPGYPGAPESDTSCKDNDGAD